MRLFRRENPEELAANIAALERELGMDDATVLAEVEQKRLERTSRHRGPVLLNVRQEPLARLHETLTMAPGSKWLVDSPGQAQVLTASAYSHVPPQPSRVVLPASVRG